MEAALVRSEESVLRKALDVGIDDMEAGRLTSHEESVRIIKERLRDYAEIQNSGN